MGNPTRDKQSSALDPTGKPKWTNRNYRIDPGPGKGGDTPNLGLPDWMTPGTKDYARQNQMLASNPMMALNNIFGSGGMSPGMNSAIGRMESLYRQAGQPGAAEKYLTSTAQGKYLDANPYIEDIVSRGSAASN